MKKLILPFLIGLGVTGVIISTDFTEQQPNLSVEQLPLPVGGDTALTVSEKLIGKTSEEKANIKSDEIVALNPIGEYIDKDFNFRIEILSVTKIDKGVQVLVRAWTNKDLTLKKQGVDVAAGTPIAFGQDGSYEIERINIYNPPHLVPDGTKKMIPAPDLPEGFYYADNYKENLTEALRQNVAHTISVIGRTPENIVPGKIGNTTSTFNPNADPETTSVDGYVGTAGSSSTWADIRTRAGTEAVSNVSPDIVMQLISASSCAGTPWRENRRGVYLYDTSALPDTDVISSATKSIFGTASDDRITGASVVITNSSPASNTNLATTDYPVSAWTSLAEQASNRITVPSWSTVAYNDFTLSASGIANISLTGVTKLGAWASYDFDNSEPTCAADQAYSVRGNYAESASNDPKLVVEHAAPAAVTPSLQDQAWFEIL